MFTGFIELLEEENGNEMVCTLELVRDMIANNNDKVVDIANT
jgi:hypothetical protein